MSTDEAIEDFLRGESFAVVGASTVRAKYGNKVLRCYLQNGRRAFPIHRNESVIEGQKAYAKLSELPERVHGVSIVTPPAITERVVEDVAEAGITRVWMQPGAESPRAIERARELGLTVIANGPCVLVSLGFRERG